MARIIPDLIMIILLFTTTFFIILPPFCSRLGFSWYYAKVDKNVIDHENMLRLRQAEQELKDLNSSRRRMVRNETPEFAVVVVSIGRRSNPHYLVQSASRLLTEVVNDNGRSQLTILNVEEFPKRNTDACSLSSAVKVLNMSAMGTNDIFEKEKLDYINALTIGIKANPKYLLVVEDDAVAMRNIFSRLRYIIRWKIPWGWLRSGPQQWAFLKLYYPEKWQGYSVSEIPELILIGFIGGLCFAILRLKVMQLPWRRNQALLYMWFVAGCVYTTLLVYLVGRAHLIELRRFSPLLYSVSKDLGCCTPAVLFPTQQAIEFVKYLQNMKCGPNYPLDFAFEDFTKEHNLKGLLVSPNLFRHIGFHSSLHVYDKDPREFRLLLNP